MSDIQTQVQAFIDQLFGLGGSGGSFALWGHRERDRVRRDQEPAHARLQRRDPGH